MTIASWYLALSLLAALTACTAVVRIPPGGFWGLLYMFVGMPAFHFTSTLLLLGVAATALAVWLGVLHVAAGQLGLALGIVAFIGLLVVRWRSHRIATAMEQALRQTLGDDYRQQIPPGRAGTPGDRQNVGVFSNPLQLRLPGVERIANLRYGDAGERNLLDLYVPSTGSGHSNLPILLWVHGGAWTVGHKAQQSLPLLYRMASRGWLVVAMNYRLGPVSRFPDMLVDIKKAIAWLRTHAAEYGADPHFIIACGGSAGGHLTTLAALTPNRPEYQIGFETVDTTLAAAVSLYGRYDFVDRSHLLPGMSRRLTVRVLGAKVMPCHLEDGPEIWDQASPIAQVGPQAPPMFVAHGTHDTLIPLAEAAAFVNALRAVTSTPVVFPQIFGAQHAWEQFNTPWTQHTVDAVHRFCEYVYARSRDALHVARSDQLLATAARRLASRTPP